jgi:LPXTG-site transpeptidase (sortase) family protein
VKPNNTSVVANDPTKRTLTLTTCHPKGSAAERLIIKANYTKGGSVST